MTRYFTKQEWGLWAGSVGLVLAAFMAFPSGSTLSLVASLIGVTSLIFNAKGHPVGQLLMVIFSLLYGLISYSSAYYGEMITYLGMTGPMAGWALISWLCHPFQGRKSEVAVNRLPPAEWGLALALTGAVTVAFYFVLVAFDTAFLPLSTLSIATSFLAVYLTARRSPWFPLVYAANDLVLIALWVLATLADPAYLSVAVCFAVFLVNDLYGFLNWRRMEQRQGDFAGNSPGGIA